MIPMTLPTDPSATAEPAGDSGEISLSDLKAKRAAMRIARLFTVDPPFGDGTLIRAGAEDSGGDDVADCAMAHNWDAEDRIDQARFEARAIGIVATHNAADALIEVAEAALAYEQARKDAAVVRFAFRTDSSDESSRKIEAHDKDEVRCMLAYQAALAKVRP